MKEPLSEQNKLVCKKVQTFSLEVCQSRYDYNSY